jgi:predicted double-glycine peptidase
MNLHHLQRQALACTFLLATLAAGGGLAATAAEAEAAAAGAAAGAAELSLGGAAPVHLRVHSIKALRFLSTIRQQYDFSCGSAAVATLLTYHYGVPVSETAAFQAMWDGGDRDKIRREGFSLLDMQRYLARGGFQADGFRLPLEKLIEAGLPAIVLVTEQGYNHFVVIKGARDGRLLLGDPSRGTRAVTREHFEAIWPTRLLFVVHTSPTRPRFNLAGDWRAAPSAPLAAAVAQALPGATGTSGAFSLPKLGPGDF